MPVMIQYPAAGIRNHSLLTGLSNDDHGQYLMLTPPNTARNTITVPTATVTGLTLKSTDDSAVLPLLSIVDSGNNNILAVKPAWAGAVSLTDNFLRIERTFPATPTAGTFIDAIAITITGNGSAVAYTSSAMRIQLLGGYSGTGSTVGMVSNNFSTSTSTNYRQGNFGFNATATGITVGSNYGGQGNAANGDRNFGLFGSATTAKANGINIGVGGHALNTDATSPIHIGGIFSLSAAHPVFESAALIADNSSSTSPIILGRDSGTKVFQVLDGGGTSITLTNAASVGLTVTGAAAQSGNLAEFKTSSATVVSIAPVTGLTASVGFLNITGTLTSDISTQGIVARITSAPSSGAGVQRGMYLNLIAGYTGSNASLGAIIINDVAGTNTTWTSGNLGLNVSANATTSGANLGMIAFAQGSSLRNMAVFGWAQTSSAGANVGVIGQALNAGAGQQIGGIFHIGSTAPTWESAALISDNGATTSLIFAARDNGTKVFEVRDGGQVYISNGTLSGGSATENFLNVTGTLPSTRTAAVSGVEFSITSSGSSLTGFTLFGGRLTLNAGYTGGDNTTAFSVTNSIAGTNVNSYTSGNTGLRSVANATTVGNNFAIFGQAVGSTTLNIAINANSATDTIGRNVGLLSRALNTTGIQTAGLFALTVGSPIFESAALIADNGSTTSPIMLARDNGTTVFSIADGGAAAITLTNAASIGLIVTGAAAQSGNLAEFRSSSGTPFVTIGKDTLSGGSATDNWLNVTGTMPASPTVAVNGVAINVTGAGSASFAQRAIQAQLLAGYTGSASTVAFGANNFSAGTASSYDFGNYAANAASTGTTTGNNIGGRYVASGADRSIGLHSYAVVAKASALNLAVLGQAINAGASGVQIAGLFSLSSGGFPTLTESAALIADNGATTSPIFLARDNGTTVFSVIDGGYVGIKTAATSSYSLDISGGARFYNTSGGTTLYFSIVPSFDFAPRIETGYGLQIRTGVYDNSANNPGFSIANPSGTNTFSVDRLGAAIHTVNTATSIGLIVKGAAAQSASLQQWQDSSGNALQIVGPNGGMTIQPNSSSTTGIRVNNGAATTIPAVFKGASSQSANLTEWWSNADAVYGTVSENGYMTTRKNAAPADAELAAGEAAYWFDSSNGASKFMIKAKSADGTVVTGEVALA